MFQGAGFVGTHTPQLAPCGRRRLKWSQGVPQGLGHSQDGGWFISRCSAPEVRCS